MNDAVTTHICHVCNAEGGELKPLNVVEFAAHVLDQPLHFWCAGCANSMAKSTQQERYFRTAERLFQHWTSRPEHGLVDGKRTQTMAPAKRVHFSDAIIDVSCCERHAPSSRACASHHTHFSRRRQPRR